ncbi:beta-1,4-galactosyltransferase 4-like [Haliotis rubra]|uniref:beta-1,4-galactosyltransferase 4-like n=1 Tax=Haliotis rubra TaxID=36100 RepID=UPI001EE58532|nr:beta-1,4-galactosyltransferase 4-like [Haliotis rubra]
MVQKNTFVQRHRLIWLAFLLSTRVWSPWKVSSGNISHINRVVTLSPGSVCPELRRLSFWPTGTDGATWWFYSIISSPFLVRQQAEFALFVIEPLPSVTFNRALLMNIGFVEALKTNNFTCFIFHDVDLLPVTDHNLYRCGATPRHMAVSNSKLDNVSFPEYAGGVVAVSRDVYQHVNGHSNLYFGWGGEDDDLLYRLNWKHYTMSRYPPAVGRYIALNHTEDVGNPVSATRLAMLETAEKRLEEDGLNTLKYKIVHKKHKLFYTWIQVDIDMKYYSSMISKWHPEQN